jgi:hypothetical protein
MGYACPVCDVPQRDAEHLANHLAFTALLRHEDHEEWLDDHLPGWSEAGPAELADRVVDHADRADYDEVFEDTVGEGHDHGGDAFGHENDGHGHGRDAPGVVDAGSLSDEAAAVLDEARAYTREMYGLEETGDETGDEASETGDETGDEASETGDETGDEASETGEARADGDESAADE